jgi:LacI family transcriptional regulator
VASQLECVKMAPQRVALLFQRDLAFCRGVLSGAEEWLADSGARWHLRHAASSVEVMDSLREWKPDGVLGHVFDDKLATALQEWGGPFINTTLTLPGLAVPVVDADQVAVGEMAADYLLGLGFRQFGFYGNPWATFSLQREEGFLRGLRRAGFEANTCYADYLPMRPARASWVAADAELSAWLQSLPKPAAVFCCHDVPARDVAEACTTLGIRVPEEIAILGVDNDRFECEITRPTLSSIALPMREIGRQAAGLLAQAMASKQSGDSPPRTPTVIAIPPVHVVARRSTDLRAVRDPSVRRALAFLQDHFTETVGVGETAQAAGLSRRQLERRFRDALGRTILSEIHRLRVDAAMKLLAETELKIEAVATRSGFSSARQMAEVFRRTLGKPPSACRREAREMLG